MLYNYDYRVITLSCWISSVRNACAPEQIFLHVQYSGTTLIQTLLGPNQSVH